MHDQTLLTQWHRNRDGEAFHELTRKYAGMTYATALRVLRNPHDAEDVTQRCFETLATNRRAPGDALGPWLHRVAVNAALDWRKRESRRAVRETSYQEAQPHAATSQWDDVYPLVDEAIAALPEKLRRAVVGHYLEQRTHAELATAEGVSREAMTQRVHRGVEQVRAALRKRGVAVPVAVLGTMFTVEFARAAELPLALKGRLGQIAVSGLAASPGAGFLAGLWATPLAKLILVACVAAFWGGYWHWQGTSMHDTVEDLSPGERMERSITQVNAMRTVAPASAAVAALLPVVQDGALPVVKPVPALAGRVYDIASGRGIEGAEVVVLTPDSHEKLLTDSEGHFSLVELAPGEYRVSCLKANGFYIPVEQRANREFRNVSIVPDKPVADVDLGLERGEAIRGRVVDRTGNPVAGATVTGGAEVVNFHCVNTAMSGEDGSFAISGFPPTLEAWVWAETDSETSVSTGPISIPSADPAGVEVLIQPKTAIRGRVVYSTGKPVAGASVHPQYRPDIDARTWEAESDAHGNFELENLPSGSLSISAHDGITSRSESMALNLEAGVDREDIELLCPLGDASIGGHVVDVHGRRLSLTRITCMSADVNASIRTDEQGTFMLTGLTPGLYRLEADRFGEYIRTVLPKAATGETDVEIVLEILPRVAGRVVDAQTNEPIRKFALGSPMGSEFITHPQTYNPMEPENGEYNVQLHSLGENIVVARAEGYALGRVTVLAEKPGELLRDVEIRMERQADLHGTVRDGAGAGVADAAIYSGDVVPTLESEMIACRTAPDGSFILPASFVAYDYLTVRLPGHSVTKAKLTKENFAGEPIDITLSQGGSIAVDVYENGKLSERGIFSVEASSPVLQSALDSKWKRNGEKFIGLGADKYRISATLDLGVNVPGPRTGSDLELAENENATTRIDLSSGTSELRGRINVEASWIAFMLLTIETESGPQLYLTRGEGQEYSFSELPAGKASFHAQFDFQGARANVSRDFIFDFTNETTIIQDFDFTDTLRISGNVEPYAGHENLRVIVFPGEVSPALLTADDHNELPEQCGSTTVERNSDFSMPGLTEGTYTLAAVSSQEAETLWLAYAVVTLGEEDITVELQPLP